MAAIAKLTLRPKTGGGAALELPYNPESLTFSASATFNDVPAGADVAGVQFMERQARSTSVTARLDARALTRSVADTVQQVFDWLEPTEESVKRNAPSPPLLDLSWGKHWFDVVLESASAEFTLFSADGAPTRATVMMTLKEVPLKEKRQNPTSGSLVGRRSHQVVSGDSLHSIATAEYGDPRHWRDLALANRLDDPLALRPGTRVLLPDLAELPSSLIRTVSPW